MKLQRLAALLLLSPVLLGACDDSSGPTDQVFTLQSVQVEGAVRPAPALLFEGQVNCGVAQPCNFRYQLRRATLALRANGQYSFSAEYPVRLVYSGNTDEYSEPTFEEGSYTIRGSTITFDADGEAYLSPTATLQAGQLTVGVSDPFEFFDSLTLTLAR